MKKVLLGLALSAAALLASDGAAIFGKCAACHGKDGKNAAVSGVAIGGEAADTVAKKLHGYKDGSFGGAKKAMMAPQVANLSDDDIKAVAAHIAGLK
jgi:cytochrome c